MARPSLDWLNSPAHRLSIDLANFTGLPVANSRFLSIPFVLESRLEPGPGILPARLDIIANPWIVAAILYLGASFCWRRSQHIASIRDAPEPDVREIVDMLLRRYTLSAGLIAMCWFGMQWVHEAGHLLGGTLGEGSIDRLVLAPWSFSRTDFDLDPHPLVSAWSGPIFGMLAPLVLMGLLRRSTLARLFAAFCLLANGVYLLFGSFGAIGDTATLMRHGAPQWNLLVVGTFGIAGAVTLFASDAGRQMLAKKEGAFTRHEIILAWTLTLGMAGAGALFFRDA